MSSRKAIDWEVIVCDYRVGQLSRALATKHGTIAGAISKKLQARR